VEKTPIRKNSITKKAIKNSFIFFLTLVQLISIHRKTNKVVKRMKKREIPSIPKLKFKFKKGIHNNLLTNWKELIDLLKKTHKNREITYVKPDTFKAIIFNNELFEAGTNNSNEMPINGSTKIKTNKLDTSNNKKSNINTL